MKYYEFAAGQTVKPAEWVAGERYEETALGPLLSGKQETFGPGDPIPPHIVVTAAWAPDFIEAGYKLARMKVHHAKTP